MIAPNMTKLFAEPEEVSFTTQDDGFVHADIYGSGSRGVVLAHGARFDKASWKNQAIQLAHAGYRVAAIDFRGYGQSHGGPNSQSPRDEMYLDVLAAADYLRSHGAETVAVIGASMGGGASANAVVRGKPGSIDRLILLAPVPIERPELITGPKLFAAAQARPDHASGAGTIRPSAAAQGIAGPRWNRACSVPVYDGSGRAADEGDPAVPRRRTGRDRGDCLRARCRMYRSRPRCIRGDP
jgi:pimeloyl-ACP methyl ester carboxylesterase